MNGKSLTWTQKLNIQLNLTHVPETKTNKASAPLKCDQNTAVQSVRTPSPL